MPYIRGGELFDHVSGAGRFTEERSRHWFKQILEGVKYMQDKGVCHRDMSLENLMVDEGTSLIIDMGMCVRVPYIKEGGGFTDKEGAGAGGRRGLIRRQTR